MTRAGITRVLHVAAEPEDFDWAIDYAIRNEQDNIALGIHPTEQVNDETYTQLETAIQKVQRTPAPSRLAAIGEIGLDYHWMTFSKHEQQQGFTRQLELAKSLDLPVIIHSRDAMEDTIAILREHHISKGIMHCYSGTALETEPLLDMGLYISFAGNVTYKSAQQLQQAASIVPAGKLLLETDCPYLSPLPLRGRLNQPDYIIHTYEFVAALRGLTAPELGRQVMDNFTQFCPADINIFTGAL
jgi:TatD DNase family protein